MHRLPSDTFVAVDSPHLAAGLIDALLPTAALSDEGDERVLPPARSVSQ